MAYSFITNLILILEYTVNKMNKLEILIIVIAKIYLVYKLREHYVQHITSHCLNFTSVHSELNVLHCMIMKDYSLICMIEVKFTGENC